MKQKFILTICAGLILTLAAACSSPDVNPAANQSNRTNANVPANGGGSVTSNSSTNANAASNVQR